ncbi:MAG: hypothetical protein MK033_02150 [Candidatus Caenarcaniphilales bacterium]|nr:hypothetical protein [Candidatus Caenarcaniphilales bacterium]
MLLNQFDSINQAYNEKKSFQAKLLMFSPGNLVTNHKIRNDQSINLDDQSFLDNLVEVIRKYPDNIEYVQATIDIFIEGNKPACNALINFQDQLRKTQEDKKLRPIFQNKSISIQSKPILKETQSKAATEFGFRSILRGDSNYADLLSFMPNTYLITSSSQNPIEAKKMLGREQKEIVAYIGTGYINQATISELNSDDVEKLGFAQLNLRSQDPDSNFDQLKPWMTGGFITYKNGTTKLLNLRDIEFSERSGYLKNLSNSEDTLSIQIIGKLIDQKASLNPKKYHLEDILDGEEACLIFDNNSGNVIGSFYTSGGVTPKTLYEFARKELITDREFSLVRLDTDWYAKYFIEDAPATSLNHYAATDSCNQILLVKDLDTENSSIDNISMLQSLKKKSMQTIQKLTSPINHTVDDMYQGLTRYLLDINPNQVDKETIVKFLTNQNQDAIKVTPKKFVAKLKTTPYWKMLPEAVQSKLNKINKN